MRWSAVLQAKNAFELLTRLPKHGVGAKLSRTGWTDDCYWTVTKVKPSPDGKHGQAWGVLTWRGTPQRPETPTQINGPLKHVWRVVQEGDAAPWQSLVGAALRQERQAAKAAAAEPAAAEGSAQAAAEAAQPAS